MRDIVLDVDLFGNRTPGEIERGRKSLLYFMEAMVMSNTLYLRDNPSTPTLYSSGVLYQIEAGTENWKDIPRILEDMVGDCEDLACWRTAEYRSAGINAHPYIKWRNIEGGARYHAVLRMPDGKIEDPSRALGMHGHPITRAPVWISDE